ncbi:ADP-ribosylation factor family-domain-containing protein [Chytridium lagenaria]|nr:ADP-ribosylation factor family-domain-containing protein [Chytridium lagenaria]
MGHLFSKVFSKITAVKREVRILVLGLDAAGKTSILYRLKLQDSIDVAPPSVSTSKQVHPTSTSLSNPLPVKYKNIVFQMWDCGGQDSIRPLWRHYFKNSNGLVFVVDSTDKSRLDEAGNELRRILESPEMEDVAVLVVANNRIYRMVTKGLRLNSLKSHNWNIGLSTGLQWLSQNMVIPEPAEPNHRK